MSDNQIQSSSGGASKNVLTLSIRACQLLENRVGANFFIVGKLMQDRSDGDQPKTQKQRTDISVSAHSGNPQFIKNKMHFHGFDSTGKSRTTLELSLYLAPQTLQDDENANPQQLLSQSIFLGAAVHTFTVNFMALLKQDSSAGESSVAAANILTRTLELSRIPSKLDADKATKNLGQLVVDFRLQINDLAEQFVLANQEIKKYHFDPFVKDPETIKQNLDKIEEITAKKIPELTELYRSIDSRK